MPIENLKNTQNHVYLLYHIEFTSDKVVFVQSIVFSVLLALYDSSSSQCYFPFMFFNLDENERNLIYETLKRIYFQLYVVYFGNQHFDKFIKG